MNPTKKKDEGKVEIKKSCPLRSGTLMVPEPVNPLQPRIQGLSIKNYEFPCIKEKCEWYGNCPATKGIDKS